MMARFAVVLAVVTFFLSMMAQAGDFPMTCRVECEGASGTQLRPVFEKSSVEDEFCHGEQFQCAVVMYTLTSDAQVKRFLYVSDYDTSACRRSNEARDALREAKTSGFCR